MAKELLADLFYLALQPPWPVESQSEAAWSDSASIFVVLEKIIRVLDQANDRLDVLLIFRDNADAYVL